MADIRLLMATVILLLHHTNREALMSTLPTIQFERQQGFLWPRHAGPQEHTTSSLDLIQLRGRE